MRFVYFTKYDPGLSPEELGRKAKRLGFSGLDLAVRPGHAVNPDNVEKVLPRAVETWKGMGLTVEIVTAPTRFTDPASPAAEAVYAACGAAGVGLVKIGYWRWRGEDYWERVDDIRRALDGFGRLGRTYGVRTCHHTHSYGFYGSNCAGAMHLLRDMDPALFGVYLDTGHMFLDGEYLPFGLAMIRGYLAAVAVKDLSYVEPGEEEGADTWDTDAVPLGSGFIHWPALVARFLEAGFSGPWSIHAEYEDVPPAVRDEMAAADLRRFRSAYEEAKEASSS